jgi:hypothetical protein
MAGAKVQPRIYFPRDEISSSRGQSAFAVASNSPEKLSKAAWKGVKPYGCAPFR